MISKQKVWLKADIMSEIETARMYDKDGLDDIITRHFTKDKMDEMSIEELEDLSQRIYDRRIELEEEFFNDGLKSV